MTQCSKVPMSIKKNKSSEKARQRKVLTTQITEMKVHVEKANQEGSANS